VQEGSAGGASRTAEIRDASLLALSLDAETLRGLVITGLAGGGIKPESVSAAGAHAAKERRLLCTPPAPVHSLDAWVTTASNAIGPSFRAPPRAFDMDRLSNEILAHIFKFVRARTLLLAVPAVCRRWRQVCREGCYIDDFDLRRVLSPLTLKAFLSSGGGGVTDVDDEDVAALLGRFRDGFRGARGSLSLAGCFRLTDRTLAAAARSQHVTGLDLSGCGQLTDAGLEPLAQMPALTALNLLGCKITGAGLAAVAKLGKLSVLSLGGFLSILAGSSLRHLAGLTTLTSLTLDGIDTRDEPADAFVGHVQALAAAQPDLALLSIKLESLSTDNDMLHLSEIQHITALEMRSYGGALGDAGLVHLARLGRLASLALCHSSHVTGAGLAHLVHPTKLDLCYCGLTDADLVHVAGLRQLTSLDLSYNGDITDEGVAHLQELPLLAALNLISCGRGVTKRGLARCSFAPGTRVSHSPY